MKYLGVSLFSLVFATSVLSSSVRAESLQAPVIDANLKLLMSEQTTIDPTVNIEASQSHKVETDQAATLATVNAKLERELDRKLEALLPKPIQKAELAVVSE